MNESISAETSAARDVFELGTMLGQRRAFSALAGRCSAADAECLRRLRESKLYLHRASTWDEFCAKYLGMSRTHANRIIRALEELGPDYFELAQLTGMAPDEFRAIAPSVRDHAVHIHGEAIALLPENSLRVSAAVAELRREASPAPAAPSPSVSDRRAAAGRRLDKLAAEFTALVGESEGEDKLLLVSTLQRAQAVLGKIEDDARVAARLR